MQEATVPEAVCIDTSQIQHGDWQPPVTVMRDALCDSICDCEHLAQIHAADKDRPSDCLR